MHKNTRHGPSVHRCSNQWLIEFTAAWACWAEPGEHPWRVFRGPPGLLNQHRVDQPLIAMATRTERALIYGGHTKYCKRSPLSWSITRLQAHSDAHTRARSRTCVGLPVPFFSIQSGGRWCEAGARSLRQRSSAACHASVAEDSARQTGPDPAAGSGREPWAQARQTEQYVWAQRGDFLCLTTSTPKKKKKYENPLILPNTAVLFCAVCGQEMFLALCDIKNHSGKDWGPERLEQLGKQTTQLSQQEGR